MSSASSKSGTLASAWGLLGEWRMLDLCGEWAQKRPNMLSNLISKLVRRLRRNRRHYVPAMILAGC